MARKRILLYSASVILYFISFPPFWTGFFAYAALIPFFLILESHSFQGGFRSGYILGLCSVGTLMYWLNWNTGATQIQATAMYLGTIMYLAVMWGIYGFLQSIVCRRLGTKGFFFAPILWSTLEFFQSKGELGFTWHLLPSTQTYYTPLIQFIEFTGITGLSFWIVLINVMFYFLIKKYFFKESDTAIHSRLILVSLLLLFFVPLTYGLTVINSTAAEKTITASVIQPNIEPNRKWLEKDFAYTEIMRLTASAGEKHNDLIVWPETAIPVRLRVDKNKFNNIRQELRRQWTTLITGIPDRKVVLDDEGNPRGHYFNSIYMIRPDHSGFVSYDKMHLVPFGEFVPSFLFFMKDMAMDVGIPDYYPGDSLRIFNVPIFQDTVQTDSVKMAGVVCLESIFPDIVRDAVKLGARVLVIVTNDAWYDGTLGPIQHSQIAVLRAVENRVSIIRCANSGISSLVDPFGNVTLQTSNATQAILSGPVAVQNTETFFTRYGNLFPVTVSILFFILLLVLTIFRSRPNR